MSLRTEGQKWETLYFAGERRKARNEAPKKTADAAAVRSVPVAASARARQLRRVLRARSELVRGSAKIDLPPVPVAHHLDLHEQPSRARLGSADPAGRD